MRLGTPQFNGLVLASGSFDFTGTGGKLEGKAAFVDTRTGRTHGWTNGTQWSPETLECLSMLRTAMEGDLAMQHLRGDSALPVAGDTNDDEPAPAGGLAEHLGSKGEDAPPI